MSQGSYAVAPPRALRASLHSGQPVQRAPATTLPAMVFSLALLAVIIEFCVSANTLTVLGLHYNEPGGNPLVKIHPASYLAFTAAIAALTSSSNRDHGLAYLFSRAPALLLFGAVMMFCAVFAAVNVGFMGTGIYVDTYLSAAALAVTMISASARQRAILAQVVLALCVINVFMSLAEYVHQDHFIPMDIKAGDGSSIGDDAHTEDFRPAALYGHPLEAAMATSFGVFLLLSRGFGFTTTAMCFGLFAVGLLGFGGRTALVATVGVLALRVTVTFARDLMRGRLNGRLLATVLVALTVLGPLTAFLLTATPIGERLVARWYFDNSADVRVDQWLVFYKLTSHQALFGVPATDLQNIYSQVGLTGVENPFILVFLNLGIIGTPVFTLGLVSYFLYLRRAYPDSGWLLLAAILILSGSNSIGVKSPDLMMLTACAVTMKGQTDRRSAIALRIPRPQVFLPHLPPKGLAPNGVVRNPISSIKRVNSGLSANVVRQSDHPS